MYDSSTIAVSRNLCAKIVSTQINVITELLYHEILFLSSEMPEGLDINVF